MAKFFLVNKDTSALEVSEAKAKGYRVIDERFRGDVDPSSIVNLEKPKPKLKKKALKTIPKQPE